jgi:hypothetical protein
MGKPYNAHLVLQNAAAATGNGTEMDVSGYSAVALQISGTFVGTVSFYGSVDASNYIACQGISYNDGSIATSATAAGLWYIPVSGFSLLRAAVTWSSGTSVTVTARAVTGAGSVATDTQLGAGTALLGKVGIDQATANANEVVVKSGTVTAVTAITNALPAGEAMIGQVVGSSVSFVITGATIGVDAATYATGQCLGAKMTLTDVGRINSGYVYLQGLIVQDLTAQASAMDLIVFNANPSGTTFTDNSALDIADADLPKISAVVSVAASDYVSFADNKVAQVEFFPRLIQTDASADLYAVLVCRGAPTYAANELSLILKFMRD